MKIKSIRNQEGGYTLVELTVTIIVTGMFMGLILFFSISYWRYGSMLESDLDTMVTRLNAGDVLREAFSSSSGLIIQNSIADNNPMNGDPEDSTGLYWEPIHAIPGNVPIGSENTTTPLVYYTRPSYDSNGQTIMNGTQPHEDEYILYLNGTTKELLLRSLANPAASDNRLTTSCPPEIATSSCPADKVIASSIESVDTRYFSRTGNLIDYTEVYDPNINQYIGPDFPTVDVIELKLNLTQKPYFQKTNTTINSTIIRVALRNT